MRARVLAQDAIAADMPQGFSDAWRPGGTGPHAFCTTGRASAYAGALPNAQVLDIASGTPRALARLELLGCSD